MANWDLVISASALKKKQRDMLVCLTEIYDALNGLREEAAAFSGIWEGTANEAFFVSFYKEWERVNECAAETGRLVEALIQVEKEYEICEKKVKTIIG